jgi:hypothetical protein
MEAKARTAKPSYELFQDFLSESDARAMRRCAEAFGPFEMYIQGSVNEGFGAGLVRRHDAAANHVKGLHDVADLGDLMARLNLYRGTYALGDDLRQPLARPLVESRKFADAAAALTGRPLVEATMLYANLLLPGQELAVHTDTPEYRGINKWNMPEWFLVVMMHSGLFEPWRRHVTAGVAFFGDCEGGEFLFYPGGPEGGSVAVPVRYNTAIHLDVDGMFHGVRRVGGPGTPAPPIEAGVDLQYAADDHWQLLKGAKVVHRYHWSELRYSVQWKANCYADADEKALCDSHRDDLVVDDVIERLVDDLRERGQLAGGRPDDRALALLMMDAYIPFPAAGLG